MLFYGVLGLMAMAAGALAITLFALPAGFVRDRIVIAVKEQTGRDLVIAGPASFTVFPSIGLSLEDVSLSGGPGFESAAPLVKMNSLDVTVALWPLLQREIRVESLRLREPVFSLEVDENGHRSWDFASAVKPSARVRLAQATTLAQGRQTDAPLSDADPAFAAGGSQSSDKRSMRVGDLALSDVRIENGSLTYRNALSGGVTELSAINVRLGLDALTAPLQAEGSVDVRGKTVRFDGTLTSLAKLAANQPAKVKVALGADMLDATFEGSATFQDALLTEGILAANSASARDLFEWFGTELPPSEGFSKLSAKGLLRGSREELTYSNAEIELDRTTAHGEISLDTRGMRPFVKANLKLSELDLNTYSSKAAKKKRAAKRAKPDSARSIDELIENSEPEQPGPRVKGYTERAGWSSEPFDFDGLGQFDADATLSIGRLTVRTLRLDQSDLKVLLKNRVMTTTLEDVRLYGGSGRGTVILDGSGGDTARLGADLKMEGIEALPLLKDAADIDRLTGTGRLVVVLTGDGTSEREVVEALAGRIEFAFEDGAIQGVNVAEMLRNLSRGNLRGLDAKPTDKTDFSALTSSWTVTGGVAENQDLRLMSPLIRLTGSGRVMLPQREVDYTLKPRLVASLSGQGGENDLSGLEIPVRVQGSWDDPKFAPDLSGLAKDPDQAIGAIRELGKQFKDKDANEIVDGLLSGDKEDRKNARETGKKLLDQFLGGR
jgi:AsmA protein